MKLGLIASMLAATFGAALAQRKASAAAYQSKAGRGRCAGPVRPAGSKLARMAAEGRVGIRS